MGEALADRHRSGPKTHEKMLCDRWRRELGRARGGFAEVVVAPTLDDREDSGAPRCCLLARSGATAVTTAAIEIDFSGSSRVRIPASIPPDLAVAVIAALRRR